MLVSFVVVRGLCAKTLIAVSARSRPVPKILYTFFICFLPLTKSDDRIDDAMTEGLGLSAIVLTLQTLPTHCALPDERIFQNTEPLPLFRLASRFKLFDDSFYQGGAE